MKNILLLLVMVFAAAVAAPQERLWAQANEEPALVTAPFEHESLVYNFGMVKEGKVLKHRFILKNDTGRPLEIKEVNTSCGCTASKVKKKRLAPDEETQIYVTFKTRGYYGPTKQFVYVHTDDIYKPVITFIVKANVEK